MKKILLTLLVLVMFSQYSHMVFSQDDLDEDLPQEMLVIGRQPGPPMWKVSNGENVLWIFPTLSLLPKNMIWESEKVAAVIEDSQEFINMRGGVARTEEIKNPLAMLRISRMIKRNRLNPNKEKLEEVVPADLYERFSLLKNVYFPRNRGIEKLRPRYAGEEMVDRIYKESDLILNHDIKRKIQQLVRQNKSIRTTDIFVELTIEGGLDENIEKEQETVDARSTEIELACFESQIELMENDIDEAKSRANAWARGFVDEFKIAYYLDDKNEACSFMQRHEVSHLDSIDELSLQLKTQWMEAVQSALESNQSTFAVLSIRELLSEGGFIDRLKAQGYEVNDPFL